MPSQTPPSDPRPDRPLGELIRQLGADAAKLLRQEITLAQAEMRAAVRAMGAGLGRVVAGGSIAAVGALTLLAGVIVLLGSLIGSYWISALIVAVVLLAVAALVGFAGAKRLRTVDPAPRQAIASARETVAWAKEEAAEMKGALRGDAHLERPSPRSLPRAGSTAVVAVTHEQARTPAPARAPAPEPRRPAPPARARGTAPAPPPREAGLVAFLKHVGKEIQEDGITGHAAKLAYYAFLAMPPALMALFGLAGLVGSDRLAAWMQQQAAVAMPAAVAESIIGPFIEDVVLNKAPGPFSVGLLLALWGGSSVFLGLMDTLNHAFDVEETRSFLKKRSLAVAIMLGSVLLFVAAAGTLLVGPAVIDALGLGPVGELIWTIARWPIAFLFMVGAFWAGYYFLPDRDQSGCARVLLRAAAIAAALWVLATAAFRVYIANFSSYSETYGFLGAFIILLLWLYVTGLVVLAGGELAAEMEKR